jgi:hypothetical protein
MFGDRQSVVAEMAGALLDRLTYFATNWPPLGKITEAFRF